MKKWLFITGLSWVLAGCTEDTFQPISLDKDFIASVNIIEPSVQFFSADGEELAQLSFEKAYTGAVLVGNDKIVLYGNQLSEIDYYQLSTGKKLKTIKTGLGSTNGYYDKESKQVFITNNKTNKVYSYNDVGEEIGEVAVRNYPMSMLAFDGKLYVVNYKDTLLSVIDINTLQVKAEWLIPSSSNGLWIDEANDQLWIGGHGEGAKAVV